jgi:HipA-like protein
MPASLHVWMNGRHVGVWTHSPGTSSFQYDPVWAAAPDRRRLSLSLDFQPGNAARKGAVVESYFDNLLPDSETIRKRLQSRFGTPSREPFLRAFAGAGACFFFFLPLSALLLLLFANNCSIARNLMLVSGLSQLLGLAGIGFILWPKGQNSYVVLDDDSDNPYDGL